MGTGCSLNMFSRQTQDNLEMPCISAPSWGYRFCQQLKYDQKQEAQRHMKQHSWSKTPKKWLLFSVLQPTCPQHQEHCGGTAGPNHCSPCGCSRAALCMAPLPVWLRIRPAVLHAQLSLWSHRAVNLQATELNLALTLPLVSVALGLSLFVQGGVVLLQIGLAWFFSPSFLQDQGTFISLISIRSLK